MKDRILVWIDHTVLNFGIVKYLKDTYDCDLYAIFDVEKNQNEFFNKQDFVEFKKIWFFRDHLHKTNKKPDIEYLKQFEKNFSLRQKNKKSVNKMLDRAKNHS